MACRQVNVHTAKPAALMMPVMSHPAIFPIITTLAQSLCQKRFLIWPSHRNTCPKLRQSGKLRTAAPVRTESLQWVIMPVHKNWTRIQKFFDTRGPCIRGAFQKIGKVKVGILSQPAKCNCWDFATGYAFMFISVIQMLYLTQVRWVRCRCSLPWWWWWWWSCSSDLEQVILIENLEGERRPKHLVTLVSATQLPGWGSLPALSLTNRNSQ